MDRWDVVELEEEEETSRLVCRSKYPANAHPDGEEREGSGCLPIQVLNTCQVDEHC